MSKNQIYFPSFIITFFIICSWLLRIYNLKILELLTLLIFNSLSIPNPTVLLLQTLNTSNSKYLLGFLSSFLTKKGCPTAFIINISLFYNLLLKSAILEAFQHEYMPINTVFSIPKPKPRPIHKKKILTCNSMQILINKFIDRKATSISFPPTLINHLLQNAIRYFLSYITKVPTDAKDVC